MYILDGDIKFDGNEKFKTLLNFRRSPPQMEAGPLYDNSTNVFKILNCIFSQMHSRTATRDEISNLLLSVGGNVIK